MPVASATLSYLQQFAGSQPALAQRAQAESAIAGAGGWLACQQELLLALGLPIEWCGSEQGLAVFSGLQLPSDWEPHALAYAGHQFGHFVPQLGDGRALLLTEWLTPSGELVDIQLKGSGRTPYSRGGDGAAPLGPVLREFILSEAMHALGVPTTRALAAVTSGDWVVRDGRTLPGAILTRVASSHLRIGTAQYVAANGDDELRQQFADYVIRRHYPACAHAEQPYLALLAAIIERQAHLIAQWMSLGFIHGVMNTDNMLLSGETIDYGPCAFMEAYQPNAVFSAIDRSGRYAYQQQAKIALWNLARLAEAWLPLFDADRTNAIAAATAAVERFIPLYEQAYYQRMLAKLGLSPQQPEAMPLLDTLLQTMASEQLDFTQSFRQLSTLPEQALHPTLHDWHQRWLQLLLREHSQRDAQTKLCAINPAVIPRNHWVEAAIAEALESSQLTIFQQLLEAVRSPYQVAPEHHQFTLPASPEQRVRRTFCGT